MPFCTRCGGQVSKDAGQCPACHAARKPSPAPAGSPPKPSRAHAEIELPLDPSRFEAVQVMAQGGMGTVFKAVQKSLARPVAIKVLHERHARDQQLVARFRREALALAKLDHPNVVKVLDYTEVDGAHCLIYEFVTGVTLAERIKEKGRLPQAEVIYLTLQIIAGLRAAHEVAIIHRDVKPENVLLQRDHTVKITDFGVARMTDRRALTEEGEVLGTVSYMAPEQLTGGDVDERADVYSAGIMFYEMLTGQLPFGSSKVGYLKEGARPTPIDQHVPGLDPDLVRLVTRMIARDARERPTSRQTFDGLRGLVTFCTRCGQANPGASAVCRGCNAPLGARTPGPAQPEALPGPVRRGVAFLVDHLPLAVVALPAGRIPREIEPWVVAGVLVLLLFRDCPWGVSPGKALARTRVMRGGRSTGPVVSFLRNAPLVPLYAAIALVHAHRRGLLAVKDPFSVGVMVFFSLLEAIAVVRDPRGHRIGDWIARTEVASRRTQKGGS